MKEIINNNKPLSESLNNRKSQDRAIEVFNKLLAKHKKPKNPFDVTRTQSYPELKPGGHSNDPV
jgi:hypothetical protein